MKNLKADLKTLSWLTACIILSFFFYRSWSASRRAEVAVSNMPSKLVELISDAKIRTYLAEWAAKEAKLILSKTQGSQFLHTHSGLTINNVAINETIFEFDKNRNLLQVDFQYGRAGVLLSNGEPSEHMPYIILKIDTWYVYNQARDEAEPTGSGRETLNNPPP